MKNFIALVTLVVPCREACGSLAAFAGPFGNTFDLLQPAS